MISKKRIFMQNFLEYPIHNIRVLLKLGGKNSFATEILFYIRATDTELKSCFSLIQSIETLSQYAPQDLRMNIVESLSVHCMQLCQLTCMELETQYLLKAGIRGYLQNMLDSIPYHPLRVGQLGYSTYLFHFEWVNRLLYDLNRFFLKHQILDRQSPLVLRSPVIRLSVLQKLPVSLLAFKQSIQNTDECKSLWEHYFQMVSVAEFSEYLTLLLQKFKSLAEENPEFAKKIHEEIKTFVTSLNRRTTHFHVHILREFRNHVYAYMQSTHPIKRSVTFLEFNQYVNQSTLNAPNEVNRIHKLSVLMNELYQNNEDFQPRFVQFKKQLSKALHERNHEKMLEILTTLQNKLITKAGESIEQEFLRNYINHSVMRLTSPLPSTLEISFNVLREEYQNESASSIRKKLKLGVLNSLIENSRRYPEKSYSYCLSYTNEQGSDAVRSLLAENRNTFFSTKHRFKDAIDQYKESDFHSIYNLN